MHLFLSKNQPLFLNVWKMCEARDCIIMLLIFDLRTLDYAFNNSNKSTRTCSSNLAPKILLSVTLLITLITHNCRKILSLFKDNNESICFRQTQYYCIILGNCPNWCKNYFQYIYLFMVLYVFRACHAHHQEKQTEWQLPEAILTQFVSPDDEHDMLETCREL